MFRGREMAHPEIGRRILERLMDELRELIDIERDFIYQLLREGKITDEARRRIEYELDLEEAGVANRGKDGGGWI